MKHRAPLVCLLLLPATPACLDTSEGAVAVDPTATVAITDNLTFTFGPDQPCLVQTEANLCDPAQGATFHDVSKALPRLTIQLEPFEIDAHEVTNRQYAHCVAKGGCLQPTFHNAVAAGQESYYGADAFLDFPVVNVTWAQAEQYCQFVDKRLPSEAEWERVAIGPDASNPRHFPADGVHTRGDCRNEGLPTSFCDDGDQRTESAPTHAEDGSWASGTADRVTETTGSVFHLFGNVSEWVADWYDPQVTCLADAPCPSCWECKSLADAPCIIECQQCRACDDLPGGCFYACDASSVLRSVVCEMYVNGPGGHPAADVRPTSGTERVLRGGSVADDAQDVCRFPSTGRASMDPLETRSSVGFRCARSL